METNRFLNVQDLKEYIHVSESFVYKKVMENQIPHIKLGSRTLFERNQIDAWVISGSKMEDDLPSLPKV